MSLTVVADYNSSVQSDPIRANLTFRKFGQECPVDLNASRFLMVNAGDPIFTGSGAKWVMEFNSSVDPGRVTAALLTGLGVDSSGLKSKPLEFQIGVGRPIVALEHLTAWWQFDEDNGTVVNDYLGKFRGNFAGHDGFLPRLDSAQAKFGNSVYFPQNAWVTTNAYASALGIDRDNPRTISLWMHAENQNKTGGFQYDPGIYGIGRRYATSTSRGIWALRGFWDTSSYRRFFSSYWGADHQYTSTKASEINGCMLLTSTRENSFSLVNGSNAYKPSNLKLTPKYFRSANRQMDG